ncbi:WD40 repeat-like protein [Serendipita vermifera]|nr:WD40 repeat-like protein [Serendipita vermifera]
MSASAPSPTHILRTHKSQINCVAFSKDNERLYSADLNGWITLTSTRTMRPLARWQAHSDSILGVQEWDQSIVSHGRDQKLHVWSRLLPPLSLGGSVNLAEVISSPPLLYSLDVNALNFCRFSLLPQPEESKALLAVPNLVDSNYIDIWTLPNPDRVHAAMGKRHVQDAGSNDTSDTRLKLGAVMAVHILNVASSQQDIVVLNVLAGYEDGSVVLYSRDDDHNQKSVEGVGWNLIWRIREHLESVMALAISPSHQFAVSVSADSKLVKYNLGNTTSSDISLVHITKHPGNGAVAVRSDGRVCAIGGWDGRIRLYSTKKWKALGTLNYHKEGCYGLCFASEIPFEAPQDDEEFDVDDFTSRSLWLASGGKDARVCIWPLKSFERT